MEPIRSDAVAGISYDPGRRTLIVQFRRGGHAYKYFHVPRWLYENLVRQAHPWRRWGKTVMAHPSVRLR